MALEPFSDTRPFRSKDAKQMQAALLLVQLGSKEQVCELLDVGLTTLNRWFREPGFRAMLEAARSEAFQTVSDELSRIGVKAAKELERLIDTPGVDDGVKARAADVLLARFIQYRELGLVENRLTDLETSLKELQEV